MSTVRNRTVQKYEIRVTTTQPFRIGAFPNPLSDIEAPVATIGGRPVIQGSTLKGAYRSQLEEYLILNYADNEAMKPCIPAPWNNLSSDERQLIKEGKYRGPVCGYEYGRGGNPICPACYLLGTAGLVGFVQVPYLYTDAAPEEGYSNRRDRATDTAAAGANRSYQIIPPGSLFVGTLEVITEDRVRGWVLGQPRPLQSYSHSDAWLENGAAWETERVLRELVVERLEAITRLGGFISKGFGNVRVEVKPIADLEAL